MININILTCTQLKEFPEWDKNRFPESEYNILYNSTEDIVWDCVVVRQDVPYPYKFKCKKGNVIYTNCEPPSAWPLPQSFTDQFDHVIVCNPSVKHPNRKMSHGFESWTTGRSYQTKKSRFFYEDYAVLEPEKTKTLSIVTSNLMSMPGHVKRVNIINKLLKDFPTEIDRYGRGYNYVDVKGDALLPYMFHICIENEFVPHYWTEKFADPLLAQSVPIYAGCPNIQEYFGEEGYIQFDVDNYDQLKRIIEIILKDPEGEYKKYKPGLEKARKILMEKENLIPYIDAYIKNNNYTEIKEYSLQPMENCRWFNLLYYKLRIKRFLFQKWYKYSHKDKC